MSPFFLVASFAHNAEIAGASKIINNGLTDWNQDVGTSHPNTERSTNLFVYNVNELPACSNPAQKKTTKHVKMTITVVRCFSFLLTVYFLLFVVQHPFANRELVFYRYHQGSDLIVL